MSVIDIIIDKIAKQLMEIEKKKEKLAYIIRSKLQKAPISALPEKLRECVYENYLFFDVSPISLDGLTIAAVDGGLVSKSLSGVDIIITRAAGVIYTYKHDSKINVKYVSAKPKDLEIIPNFSAVHGSDLDVMASFHRELLEKKLALKIIKDDTPNVLLLDGSIFSNPFFYMYSMYAHDANIDKLIEEVFSIYSELFEVSNLYNVYVVGVIKDSRKRSFINWLLKALPMMIKYFDSLREILDMDYRGILKTINDVIFLHSVLNKSERTAVFAPYELKQLQSPLLNKIIKKIYSNLGTFYLKPVDFDLPLRIEFFSPDNDIINSVIKIASILIGLSSYSSIYSFPSILVEADNRAKVLQKDAELIYRRLLSKTQFIQLLHKKRREKGIFPLNVG
ncbi:MAG: DNA double-strand break repair nuclease NurA [Candidatus Asgardarchaeum sp.]